MFHETCFEKLKTLRLSWYENVTDQGLHALELAVQDAGTHGLPMLKLFEADVDKKDLISGLGVRAVASALIQYCPRLETLRFHEAGEFKNKENIEKLKDDVAAVVRAAGCEHRVQIEIS